MQTKASLQDYLLHHAKMRPEAVERLLQHTQTRECEKGEILMHVGQVCRQTFFVETGLLRLFSTDSKGREHVLQFAPENGWITDRSSLYFNEPSGYQIDAIVVTRVRVLEESFFGKARELSPVFRRFNEQLLQNHIRHLQHRINLLIGADAETRYMDFVQRYPDLMLRVPQWMIASYLGITPESLSRVRRDLAEKNFKK
ncbi:MAG: Crp/Fnr family transcriptional regulator [Cryomorphaceae bacterium]|nr:MAG: Crp/Fnr family transcriptional regulator [Cryomorphaceae bacterium]